jgi:subtilisin family serine protease/subtilisin-like proprotein convertase family protein
MLAQTFTFSDGGHRAEFRWAKNELYVQTSRGTDAAEAAREMAKVFGSHRVIRAGSSGLVLQFREAPADLAEAAVSARGRTKAIEQAAPVFYTQFLEANASEARRESERRVMTAKLLVKRGGQQALPGQPLSRTESLVKGWDLVEYADPFAAWSAALAMASDGFEFTPVFARQWSSRQVKATGTLQRTVNDPLFANQWHLANEGQGIKMNASWDVATGKGINVTVVDDGLEVAHEDLAGNAYPLASKNHRNFNEGDPDDPTPSKPDQNHGTNCGGLIAGVGFNNVGVIGVAPEARLMGLRLIAGNAAEDATGTAMTWQPNGLVTHVSSNSWGPADDGKTDGKWSSLQAAGVEQAATTYRDGLGTVFAVSGGNGRGNGDDSSYDHFASSRFTIGVGAVNREGKPSSYSEAGINIAVSAYGGEFDPGTVTWTTNNSGDAAMASLKQKFPASQAPVNYSDAFNGTSAAAPQVSGAAALLLQRNPRLSYRDVKEILIRTATKTGLSDGDEFRTNGGGVSFSHNFGAGVINVSAALDLAEGFTPLGALQNVSLEQTESKNLPDGAAEGALYSFDFSGQPDLRVEHVEFLVNVEHPNRGDVGFILTSPSGMISVVNNRPPDEAANFQNYLFTSVRHWGESSRGTWTVRVIDIRANQAVGKVNSVAMRIYGTAK